MAMTATDYETISLLEAYGCNATLFVVGNPSFSAADWIGYVARSCGGYVGHLRLQDISGFFAFVPAEGEPGGREAVKPPAKMLQALDDKEHELVQLLIRLASAAPVLEASVSLGKSSLDLARDIQRIGSDRQGKRIRPATSAGNALADMLQTRIRKTMTSGGFLLSAPEAEEPLVITAKGEAPFQLKFSGTEVAISERAPAISVPDISRVLEGRDWVRNLTLGASGSIRLNRMPIVRD